MTFPVRPSPLRALVTFVVGLETGLAVVIVIDAFVSGFDTQMGGFDRETVVFVTGLFAFTTAPAAGLLLWGRWLWLAGVLTGLPVLAAAYRMAG